MMKIKFMKIFEEKYNFYEFSFFVVIWFTLSFFSSFYDFPIQPSQKNMHNMKQIRNTRTGVPLFQAPVNYSEMQ